MLVNFAKKHGKQIFLENKIYDQVELIKRRNYLNGEVERLEKKKQNKVGYIVTSIITLFLFFILVPSCNEDLGEEGITISVIFLLLPGIAFGLIFLLSEKNGSINDKIEEYKSEISRINRKLANL